MQDSYFNLGAEFAKHPKAHFLRLTLLYILQSGVPYHLDLGETEVGVEDAKFHQHTVKEIQKANQLISAPPSPQKHARIDNCIRQIFPMYPKKTDTFTLIALIINSLGGGQAAKNIFRESRAQGRALPEELDGWADHYDQLFPKKSAAENRPKFHDVLDVILREERISLSLLLCQCIEHECLEMTMYLLQYVGASLSEKVSLSSEVGDFDALTFLYKYRPEFFLKLLTAYPSVSQYVSGEALYQQLHDREGVFQYYSVLFHLCCFFDGSEIFTILLANNPKLAEQISGDVLCQPITVAGQYANFSVLYLLCSDTQGQALFATLLDNNPGLARQVTGDALCRPVLAAVGIIAGASALLMLCHNETGLDLFVTLLKRNSKLAKQITGEALCRLCGAAAGVDRNISPLFELCKSQKGHDVITYLLKHHPELAQQISGRVLLRRLSSAAPGKFSGQSCLSLLQRTPQGQDLLEEYFGYRVTPNLLTSKRKKPEKPAGEKPPAPSPPKKKKKTEKNPPSVAAIEQCGYRAEHEKRKRGDGKKATTGKTTQNKSAPKRTKRTISTEDARITSKEPSQLCSP